MKRTIPRPTEAALKREVMRVLPLVLGNRGRVLRMNAGVTVLRDQRGVKRVIKGVEPGTPDLCVLLPGGRVIWFELKGIRGHLGLSQVAWHGYARAIGHTVIVARTVSEVVDPVRAALGEAAA